MKSIIAPRPARMVAARPAPPTLRPRNRDELDIKKEYATTFGLG